MGCISRSAGATLWQQNYVDSCFLRPLLVGAFVGCNEHQAGGYSYLVLLSECGYQRCIYIPWCFNGVPRCRCLTTPGSGGQHGLFDSLPRYTTLERVPRSPEEPLALADAAHTTCKDCSAPVFRACFTVLSRRSVLTTQVKSEVK